MLENKYPAMSSCSWYEPPRRELSMKWEFYQDINAKWHYIDNAKVEESTVFFSSKVDCILNAKSHGYVNPIDDLDLYKGSHE